ncbi:hypothetical protein HDV01_004799 [Terramyces sp. JEL0728]|nr:hypothetical protein HDV01_004799 [Terramyces sp. JEL0728]
MISTSIVLYLCSVSFVAALDNCKKDQDSAPTSELINGNYGYHVEDCPPGVSDAHDQIWSDCSRGPNGFVWWKSGQNSLTFLRQSDEIVGSSPAYCGDDSKAKHTIQRIEIDAVSVKVSTSISAAVGEKGNFYLTLDVASVSVSIAMENGWSTTKQVVDTTDGFCQNIKGWMCQRIVFQSYKYFSGQICKGAWVLGDLFGPSKPACKNCENSSIKTVIGSKEEVDCYYLPTQLPPNNINQCMTYNTALKQKKPKTDCLGHKNSRPQSQRYHAQFHADYYNSFDSVEYAQKNYIPDYGQYDLPDYGQY